MASSKRNSMRSAGRKGRGAEKRGSTGQSRKPSGPARLHESARKQTTAIARGTASKKKSKGQAAGSTGPSPKSSPASSKPGKGKAKIKGAKIKLSKIGSAVQAKAKKVAAQLAGKKTKTSGKQRAAASSVASGAGRTGVPRVRPVIRKPDVLESQLPSVSPSQQSFRGPFDRNRSDALRDQEVKTDFLEDEGKWREEDRFTNHSGDKRIGTHHRDE